MEFVECIDGSLTAVTLTRQRSLGADDTCLAVQTVPLYSEQ